MEQLDEISLLIDNKVTLYSLYMPYFTNAALFIETNKKYELGEMLTVHVQLLEETTIFSYTGKVVWLTPRGAQGGMTAGVAVEFSEEAEELKKKIETYLAGSLDSDRRTATM